MSATPAWVAVRLWTRPRRSVPTCSFIPECHAFPLRVCSISGSRAWAAFFVELGAAMIVASTIVPLLSSSRFAVSSSLTASKIAAVSRCCSSRLAKAEDCRLVRHHVVPARTAGGPAAGLAVIDRVLLRVGEILSLPEEVHAPHLLEPERLPPPPSPRVVGLDQREQLSPRDHGVHLGEELLP